MKIISISKKKFEELKPLVLSKEIFNTEGNIYEFYYNGKKKVVKEFSKINTKLYTNQLYTISALDFYKEYLPTNFCIPNCILSVNNNYEAFGTSFVEGNNLSTILNNRNINTKEHLLYLKKIGEILQQLKNIRDNTSLKDIFLNDLHESNFIVNKHNGELTVIDLDSCKIENNDIFPARRLTPFSLLNNVEGKYNINISDNSLGYVEPDENTDIYCYIITILNYLYGKNVNNMTKQEFYEYLNYLEHIKLDKNLITMFYKILTNEQNENPLNYLDSIKEEQVYKAKEYIYKK